MADKIRNYISERWIFAVFLCLAGAAMVAATVLLRNPGKGINSFQACKDAGGVIMESYPERCMIDGKSFRNEEQSIGIDVGEYIGLEEQAALDKAAGDKKSARTVERDGESLPVTMDYIPGRLNFLVKNGKVDRVRIEGDEGR